VVVGEDLAARWRGVARELYVTPFAIVDTDDVVSVGEVAGEWHDPTRLLSVGRLDPEKNPLLLPKLLGDLGVGFHMRVIGDGKLRVAVGQRARSLGVIDSFELAGHIPFGPALRQEFRNADCLVHISHTEGVPQVLYEAMAAGLPIVATDVGGVRSALGNGRSGSFVPPNDTKAMASEINRMAANPSKRREMALHGREEVLRHTLDKQAAGLAAFFEANRSLERPR
jgi:glycosyltransferase involved in cell wall biosynthesis